jgi:hypothetical protein
MLASFPISKPATLSCQRCSRFVPPLAPTPLEPVLLQTKAKVPFDRSVTERSKALLGLILGFNRRCSSLSKFFAWLIADG